MQTIDRVTHRCIEVLHGEFGFGFGSGIYRCIELIHGGQALDLLLLCYIRVEHL